MSAKATIIGRLCEEMASKEASDLFITVGKIPSIRVHGILHNLDTCAPISESDFIEFTDHALSPRAKALFAERGDMDTGLSMSPTERFRINLYREQGRDALVARRLPLGNLEFDGLGLPDTLKEFASAPRGLVLVTGATGSGKSTTLASLIHYINSTSQRHIVTIEDPIEFVHSDIRSRVSQREVGDDTDTFHHALKYVVRQSPDVIVLGEMRDVETVTTAMAAALTGHLVLATLHTIDASQTLQRVLSFFPEDAREQAASDLGMTLLGIVSQRLLPTADRQGRCVAVELLTATPPVSRLIRENRVDDIQDFMRSTSDPRICSFNQSLLRLLKEKKIDFKTGKHASSHPEEFTLSAQGMSTGVTQFVGEGKGLRANLDMKTLLRVANLNRASDLHLSVGRPPTLRVDGKLKRLNFPDLTPADMRILLYSILSGRQRTQYELEREIDFALSINDGSRFRVNAYFHKGNMATALRSIQSTIPSPTELGIPHQLMRLASRTQGLLLVVGPTGSGKTTSMACMLDQINKTRPCRIITIEDPIEYVYEPALATIDQREIGADTHSFAAALKYILRQDPDVVFVGEMRDLETISSAITAAETGHLVMATLHTNDAIQAIDRMIDVFPPQAQSQVRSQLAASLLGVISQRLLPHASGDGRVAAFEVLVANYAMRTLIRDNKMHQAAGVMETSMADGMVTMDMALRELIEEGQITPEVARPYTTNPKSLL